MVLVVKNHPANGGDIRDVGLIKKKKERDVGSIPGLQRAPWRRAWQPTPVFLPGEFHGQRSLAGYSPWGHTESDTTEVTEHACSLLIPLLNNIYFSIHNQVILEFSPYSRHF